MNLGDILNSINFGKNDLFGENEEVMNKAYVPFVINRSLSYHTDGVLLANEMNKHPNLDKDMQYSFYLNTLRKRKRFSPWLKKEQVEDLDLVKKHYGYSNEKAKIALTLLTKSQLEFLRKTHDMGGKR